MAEDLTLRVLRGIYWEGLPDKERAAYHELPSNLQAGAAKRYDFPVWTRNFYVENLDSTDTAGTAGYLYVWQDWGEEGTKQLPNQPPKLYESLVSQGDFLAEHSRYQYLMVMPDKSATAPEYVVKFTGRKVGDLSTE